MQDASRTEVIPSNDDSDGTTGVVSFPPGTSLLNVSCKRELAIYPGAAEPSSKRTKQLFTDAEHGGAAGAHRMPCIFDDNSPENATHAEIGAKDAGLVIATNRGPGAAPALALETAAKPAIAGSETGFGSTCHAGMAILAELKTQLLQDSEGMLQSSISTGADGPFDCINDIQAHTRNSCATTPSLLRTSSGHIMDGIRASGTGESSAGVEGDSPYRPVTGGETEGPGAVEDTSRGACDTGGAIVIGDTGHSDSSKEIRVAITSVDFDRDAAAARDGVMGCLGDVRSVCAGVVSCSGADVVDGDAGVSAVIGSGIDMNARHASDTAVNEGANDRPASGAGRDVEPISTHGEPGEASKVTNTDPGIIGGEEASRAVGPSAEADATSPARPDPTSALVVSEDAPLVFAPDEPGGAGYANPENFTSIGEHIAPSGLAENSVNTVGKGNELAIGNLTEGTGSNQGLAATTLMPGFADSKKEHQISIVHDVSSSPGLNVDMSSSALQSSDRVAQATDDVNTPAATAVTAPVSPGVSLPVPSSVENVSVRGGSSVPETNSLDHAFACSQAIAADTQSVAGTTRPEGAHPCGECGIAFDNPQALEYHTDNFHSQSMQTSANGNPARPRPFPCLTCGRAFLRTGDLNRHRNVVHGRVRKSICSICKAGFGHAGDRNRHEIRVHERGEFHQCELCAATFGSKAAHVAHLKIHAKRLQSGTPYECTHCSKSFASEAERDSHSSEAHIVNKHSCRFEFCSEAFPTARSLKAHVQSKHEQVIRCDLCPATFRETADLFAHRGKRHAAVADKPV